MDKITCVLFTETCSTHGEVPAFDTLPIKYRLKLAQYSDWKHGRDFLSLITTTSRPAQRITQLPIQSVSGALPSKIKR